MLRLIAFLLARTPPRELERMASVGAWLLIPLDSRRRQGHRKALARLLGGCYLEPSSDPSSHPVSRTERAAISMRASRNHLLWALEYLAEMGGRRFPVELAPDDLPEVPTRGRLVVTLHRGQWISGARVLSERAGSIETIAGVQLLGPWQRHIQTFARAIGVRLHGPGSLPDLDRALRRGGTVVLHLDGHPDPERSRVRMGRLPFGVRAAAVLADRTGCEVIAAVCDRAARGKLRLSWEHLEADGAIQSGSGRRRAWESTLYRKLVRWVAEDPSAWILFDPRPLGTSDAGPLSTSHAGPLSTSHPGPLGTSDAGPLSASHPDPLGIPSHSLRSRRHEPRVLVS